jgi:hypothetical protein
MFTKDFNALSLNERSKLVFGEAKLIGIFKDHTLQKAFYYKLGDLKIDVVYDKVLNTLLSINAWESATDRGVFPIAVKVA